MKFLFLIFLIYSCATSPLGNVESDQQYNGSRYYELSDKTGNFLVKREVKLGSKKLLTRTTVLTRDGMQELEKQVSVSKIGNVKGRRGAVKALLPEAAQFVVWYNKKAYSAQQKVNTKQKTIKVKVKDPDGEKKAYQEFKVPKGSYFCYFSQIPECLKIQNLLFKAANKSIQIFVLWDNFPFHTEQYEGVINSPMILATLKLNDHSKDELKYALDIGNQMIFYHFDKKLNFDKMFWISQGISMLGITKE